MAERCSHPLVIPLLDTHAEHFRTNTHFCHEQHVSISPMTQNSNKQTLLHDRHVANLSSDLLVLKIFRSFCFSAFF